MNNSPKPDNQPPNENEDTWADPEWADLDDRPEDDYPDSSEAEDGEYPEYDKWKRN